GDSRPGRKAGGRKSCKGQRRSPPGLRHRPPRSAAGKKSNEGNADLGAIRLAPRRLARTSGERDARRLAGDALGEGLLIRRARRDLTGAQVELFDARSLLREARP